MADLAVKPDPTETRLAALDMPSCGAWGRAVREAALARLRAMGRATNIGNIPAPTR